MTAQSKLPFYLEYKFKNQVPSNSLSNQLCKKNVFALTLKIDSKRGFSLNQSIAATQSLQNICITLGHIDHEIEEIYDNIFIDFAKLYNRIGLKNDSLFSGYFRPLVNVGEKISVGTLVVAIINLYGEIVHTSYSPKDGYIIAFEEENVIYPQRNFATMIASLS